MFNISEINTIERGELDTPCTSDDQPSVSISRNQTDPSIIEDGIVNIGIFYETDDRFRVEYWGYMSGCLWITSDGVHELKQIFLDNTEKIPRWTLATEITDLPDWFPTPEKIPSPVTCDKCGSEVSVTEIKTTAFEDPEARFCPSCYLIRDQL